jgi:hypothetical protein
LATVGERAAFVIEVNRSMSDEPLSPSRFPPADATPSAEFNAEALARRVDADMSALFAGRSAPAPPATRPRWRAPSFTVQNLGALAAAGLVGLAAGMMLKASEGPRAQDSSLAAAPRPQLETTRWATSIVAAPAPPPAPARAAPPKVVKASPTPKGGRDCRSARCEWRALMAADRRLRRSYSAATRAGVPRRVLAAYREDWSDARRAARRRPGVATAAFARLAERLDREAQRVRRPPLRYALKD